MFVSPQTTNTNIFILPFLLESEDDELGQYGIHANKNINKIYLPKTKVPLNIYNNEKSSCLLNEEMKTKKVFNNSIYSLNDLIVYKGTIEIKLPDEINQVEFNEIISYKNYSINSFSNNIKVNNFTLKLRSSLTISNAIFTENIISGFNSILKIKEKAFFDEQKSILKLTDTSFINFGKSKIEGICKEIKITNVFSQSLFSIADDVENIIELICGSDFDCSSWKEKFIPNEMYKSAKCIKKNVNNEVCLVASNKEEKKMTNKNSLSTGAIVRIVLDVSAVVIIAIIVGIVLWQKKYRPWRGNDKYQLEELE